MDQGLPVDPTPDESAPAPVPAEPPVPAAPRRRARVWLAGLLVVVLAGAGLVSAVVVRDDGEVGGFSAPSPWPAEMRPYVDFVEDERDLDFVYPVPVEFLTPADFRADVTADRDDLSGDEREELKQATSMLRAVGLVEGRLDLFEATNDLAGAGVIGYYSYKDKRIRIRGSTLTPAAKVILVHELTHALQDQHFDLAKRRDAFEDDEDSAGATAFDALVEGDASRIETAYRESLSDDERAELDEEESARAEKYEENVTEIPEILQTFAGAPYALGEAMLDLAVEIDGNEAVDALFRDPPTTEEHLLDPWTLLEDEDAALDVTKPRLPAGQNEFDSGSFGAMTWYLMLAERIPLVDAFDAADGWGGDSYVAFERGGVTCVRVNQRSDSNSDREQMDAALHEWIAALPGAPASVHRIGDVLTFESCDPGTAADVGSDSSGDALQLALARTYIAIDFYSGSGEPATARCFGDRVVHEFTLKQLTGPSAGDDDLSFQTKLIQIARRCL